MWRGSIEPESLVATRETRTVFHHLLVPAYIGPTVVVGIVVVVVVGGAVDDVVGVTQVPF